MKISDTKIVKTAVYPEVFIQIYALLPSSFSCLELFS